MTTSSAAADDLSIPAFLRRKPGVSTGSASTPGPATSTAEHLDDWQIALNRVEPKEFREYIEEKMRQGRFARRWLVVREPYHTENAVEETLSHFRVKWEERAAKAAANAEAARGRLREAREASPTRGMVPLREVLEGMGEEAPKRRHALAAIDAAKLEHVKYHFPPNSPVTIARVQQVIREYVPPVKEKGKPDFDPAAVIAWVGKNPKKPGTSAHKRWEQVRMHDTMTVKMFLADGGNPTTLKNALLRGSAQLKTTTKESDKCNSPKEASRSRERPSRGKSSGRKTRRTSSSRAR